MTLEDFEAMVAKAAAANVALFRRTLAEAIAAEREACAVAAEELEDDGVHDLGAQIAAAIRARGTESAVTV